jgi:hypothetical protein
MCMAKCECGKGIIKELLLAAISLFIILLVIGRVYQTTLEGRAATTALARKGEAKQRSDEIERKKERLAEMKTDAISAAELMGIYQRHEVSADSLFRGHRVMVLGTVGRITRDVFGTSYMTLDETQSGFGSVQCLFNKSEDAPLAVLLPGESVYISGTLDGKMMSVLLTDCTILE